MPSFIFKLSRRIAISFVLPPATLTALTNGLDLAHLIGIEHVH
jgi:hypothetical protein